MREELPEVPDGASDRIGGEAPRVRDPDPPENASRGAADKHGGHGDRGHQGSVRRRHYRGHTIQIVTHYEITIDGEPWSGHVQVMDDGTVHYHGMPQYSPQSLVDLMERVVDIAYAAPKEVRDAAKGYS